VTPPEAAVGKCYAPVVKLHLVDGTYELYRAHYARRPDHREPSGMDVKATVGIVESLLALLHDPEEAVTHVAVAFDIQSARFGMIYFQYTRVTKAFHLSCELSSMLRSVLLARSG
jgi:5'-3' exonuclease, N-terminal resolvase-like domain